VLVVDSSVWIDYFNGRETVEVAVLDSILGTEEILIGDLILAEVLQGFRHDRDFRRARRLFSAFRLAPMVGTRLAVRSAQNYRRLRRRGVTIRKTMDVLISTFCIARGLPLLHSDGDFDPMVEHLGLRLWA
jgi:predicted nucleic acid-binding protein